MKNNRFRLIGVLVCSLFILFSCKSFGDSIIGAKGLVKDITGKPIEGVTVVIEKTGSMPRKTVTAQDGLFDVSLIGAEADKTKISFTKSGYKTFEKHFDSEGRKTFDVTLESE